MPTLASMFGAVDLPAQPKGNYQLTAALYYTDEQKRLPEMSQEQYEMELQKGILMQTAIGK